MSRGGIRDRLEPWLRSDSPSLDLALRLTFVMFIYYAHAPDFPLLALAPLSIALMVGGLIWPTLLRSRWLWLYLVVVVIWARLPLLLVMDNHHFLIAYWFIAVAACLLAAKEQPEPLIARNARLLLGLAMAFAVVAKLRSGEFANGDFFEFLLLSGERFAAFSELVVRVSAEDLAANQRAVASLLTPGLSAELVTEVGLRGPERVGPVALLLSVWTLLVEGVIAVAFLLPGRARLLRAARNVSLLAFAFSTYAIATVTGFAWILIVLGIAQCEEEDDLARFGYCLALVLVLAYALPWGAWLRGAGL